MAGKKGSDSVFSHMVEGEDDQVELHVTDHPSNQDTPVSDSIENILKVNPADFEYDEITDTVKLKLKRGAICDEKIVHLKSKVLQTLKLVERRKRDLSCESVKSTSSNWDVDDTSRARDSSTVSRGCVRNRSESEDDLPDEKKTQHQSRSSAINSCQSSIKMDPRNYSNI